MKKDTYWYLRSNAGYFTCNNQRVALSGVYDGIYNSEVKFEYWILGTCMI